jgi:ABC-2 type transport system ATP-binding protein
MKYGVRNESTAYACDANDMDLYEGAPMTEYAIQADGLAKSFGRTQALRQVSLRVPAGSVCALLGRNGAGKTTIVRILTTLIRPDAGRAEVAGFDVTSDPARVRARIGVAGQSATMDELLTGQQNLDIIGRMYHLGPARSQRRAGELLDQFGLTGAAERTVKTYSGGMRRRLDLAASLVADPPVLFLDEPTSGLDPVSRAAMWQAIRNLVARGTTVLLTTQHLDEADQLADDIVVISGGVVAASGTPAQLTGAAGQPRLRVTLTEAQPAQLAGIRAALGPDARTDGRAVIAPAPDGLASLAAAISRLEASGAPIHQAGLEHPTLDELFATLTGDPGPEDPGATGSTPAYDGGARRLETTSS